MDCSNHNKEKMRIDLRLKILEMAFLLISKLWPTNNVIGDEHSQFICPSGELFILRLIGRCGLWVV